MIVVDDVLSSEDFLVEALDRHSQVTIGPFRYSIIVLSLTLVAVYVLFILGVIRSEVVAPIRELTDALKKPKGLDEIQTFVNKIQLKSIRDQKKAILRKQQLIFQLKKRKGLQGDFTYSNMSENEIK